MAATGLNLPKPEPPAAGADPVEKDLAPLRADIIIEQELCGLPMVFHSTWGLFSPRGIDEGTRLLLRHVQVDRGDDILDVGCGYGPVGLTLAKLAPDGNTLLVDKDFVAIEYTQKNIGRNRINNAKAMLSNGLAHIDRDMRFDLVVSNIPAKTGREMLTLLLNDVHTHLKPGGRLYIVTVNGLRKFMRRNLELWFGNYRKIKQGPGYTVAMAEKPSGSGTGGQ